MKAINKIFNLRFIFSTFKYILNNLYIQKLFYFFRVFLRSLIIVVIIYIIIYYISRSGGFGLIINKIPLLSDYLNNKFNISAIRLDSEVEWIPVRYYDLHRINPLLLRNDWLDHVDLHQFTISKRYPWLEKIDNFSVGNVALDNIILDFRSRNTNVKEYDVFEFLMKLRLTDYHGYHLKLQDNVVTRLRIPLNVYWTCGWQFLENEIRLPFLSGGYNDFERNYYETIGIQTQYWDLRLVRNEKFLNNMRGILSAEEFERVETLFIDDSDPIKKVKEWEIRNKEYKIKSGLKKHYNEFIVERHNLRKRYIH